MESKHAKRLHKHANLTDILIQFEDFLDGLDLYVFKNWFEGEIHEGPEIRRYWVDVTLIYDYNKMPDPQGGIRLTKHGAKVRFEKGKREVAVDIKDPSDYRPGRPGKPKMEIEEVWLIHISVPRKFISELDDDDLELFDDDVNIEDVSDARDESIDEEDAYMDGQGDPGAELEVGEDELDDDDDQA